MNAIVKQFKTGLYMATQSFNLLWYQKKLLLYLGSLALINIGFKLLVTNMGNGAPFFSLFKIIHHHIAALPSWTIPLETVLVLFIGYSITTFFTLSLLHHIADLLHDKPSPIRANLMAAAKKIKTILYWALLSSIVETIITFLIEHVSSKFSLLECLAISLMVISWLLGTFFVLPLMTTDNKNLLSILRSSIAMSTEKIISIMGGESWFGLMILLVATPFFFIWLLASQPSLTPLFLTFGLLCAEIVVKCWIATAHNIFKMMLTTTPSSLASKG